MTENGGVEQGISRDEALDIAAKKLRAKRVTVVTKAPEGEVVRVRKEPGVSQLIAAHYEKLVSGLEEGSKKQIVARQMERFVYDAAKASGVAMGVADFAIGGLLSYQGARSVFGKTESLGTIASTPIWETKTWKGGRLKLLAGIGAWRYAPATMVARTALNLTL